jgi:hypothetical protein
LTRAAGFDCAERDDETESKNRALDQALRGYRYPPRNALVSGRPWRFVTSP